MKSKLGKMCTIYLVSALALSFSGILYITAGNRSPIPD